jgi:hypothetical protein
MHIELGGKHLMTHGVDFVVNGHDHMYERSNHQ